MTTGFDLEVRRDGFTLAARARWTARTVALFGASGSGKSTVLETLVGVRPDVRGRVWFAGEEVGHLPPHRRGFGWVPQEAPSFPGRTVRANLELAAGWRGDAAAFDRAVEALDLGPLLERGVDRLSGGERQRVAIARALASKPRFLLLDEPLASIDRPLRSRLLPYLRRLHAELALPTLLVSHDPAEVLALAEHVVVLGEGRVVAEGDPRSVFHGSATFGALVLGDDANRFEVRETSHGPGVLHLCTAGGAELVMAFVPGFPPPRRVAVRGEDIVLAVDPPGRVSAQNVLPGRVLRTTAVGAHVDVELRAAGELWRVKVTERAVRELGLAEGVELFLLVKAHAVLAAD